MLQLTRDAGAAGSLQPPPSELEVVGFLNNLPEQVEGCEHDREAASKATVNQVCHHTDSRPTVSKRKSVQQCNMSLSVHGSARSTPSAHTDCKTHSCVVP